MIWLFFACLPEPTASLVGEVLDRQDNPVPYTAITVRDQQGDIFASTEADAEGRFEITTPPLEHFFVILSTEGMVTHAFTGAPSDGKSIAPKGALWLRSVEEVDTVLTLYDDCPESGYGVIDGEIRLDIPEQEMETLPTIPNATVKATSENDIQTTGCYQPEIIDETTETSSSYTGDSGSFAVMDLAAGRYILQIAVEYDNMNTQEYEHLVYVPENGSAPLYPALIPLF